MYIVTFFPSYILYFYIILNSTHLLNQINVYESIIIHKVLCISPTTDPTTAFQLRVGYRILN